jgi:hypothetical protein
MEPDMFVQVTPCTITGISGAKVVLDSAVRLPLTINKRMAQIVMFVLHKEIHIGYDLLIGTDVLPALGGLTNVLGGDLRYKDILGQVPEKCKPPTSDASTMTMVNEQQPMQVSAHFTTVTLLKKAFVCV